GYLDPLTFLPVLAPPARPADPAPQPAPLPAPSVPAAPPAVTTPAAPAPAPAPAAASPPVLSPPTVSVPPAAAAAPSTPAETPALPPAAEPVATPATAEPSASPAVAGVPPAAPVLHASEGAGASRSEAAVQSEIPARRLRRTPFAPQLPAARSPRLVDRALAHLGPGRTTAFSAFTGQGGPTFRLLPAPRHVAARQSGRRS